MNNSQGSLHVDPSATANVTVQNVNGAVNATSAALGNSLSVSGVVDRVNSTQVNTAPINATANTTIYNVNGAVTQTAAAIGNSATITIK